MAEQQSAAAPTAVVTERGSAAVAEETSAPAPAVQRPPVKELALMSHSSLEHTLSDRMLTLLNRATEDVPEPPPQECLQGLSHLSDKDADAALDWLRRRIFQTDSLVVRHKTLVTLRIMCENSATVLAALRASDVALLDIEGQRNFDIPGADASLARPVELVRGEAEAILALAREPEHVLSKTKSRGQQVAKTGIGLLSPRRRSPKSPHKKGGAGGDPLFDDGSGRERSLSPVGRINKDSAITAATSVGGAIVTMTKESASFTKTAAKQVKQDAGKAKGGRDGTKSPLTLDESAIDIDAVLALADAELEHKLSTEVLTLLIRCTNDEPKPPPGGALRGLSETIGQQSSEARAGLVEWLRRRAVAPGNALITHKTLVTLRVLLENASPAVKPKLTENGRILGDVESLTQFYEIDPVAGSKPAEMVREAAASVIGLAQRPDQSDLEATATKATKAASKFGRFGLRKSKAAIDKANELRVSMGGGGSPRSAAEPLEPEQAAQWSTGADGGGEDTREPGEDAQCRVRPASAGEHSVSTVAINPNTPTAEEGIPSPGHEQSTAPTGSAAAAAAGDAAAATGGGVEATQKLET